MGSKKLKAIVIDGSKGSKPPIADPEGFKRAQKEYTQALMAHPQTATYRDFGTAAMVMMCQGFGALPTRNFSAASLRAPKTSPAKCFARPCSPAAAIAKPRTPAWRAVLSARSNVFGDMDGKAVVSPLEYETISLMGSNLGIDDLDTIARLNYEVNDLGLDSIEIGAALGVAAEAGLLKFGDGRARPRADR